MPQIRITIGRAPPAAGIQRRTTRRTATRSTTPELHRVVRISDEVEANLRKFDADPEVAFRKALAAIGGRNTIN